MVHDEYIKIARSGEKPGYCSKVSGKPQCGYFRSLKENPDKDRKDLNSLNQIKLNVIYKTLHATTAKYTFFLDINEEFSRVDHRTNVNKIK